MSNSGMNRELGTKWFTFYTKVRPWLLCLIAVTSISDFVLYADVYIANWWLLLGFIGEIVGAVLGIMVFVKSKGDYTSFVNFVKGVLLFEVINWAYGNGVNQYIEYNFNLNIAFIVGAISLLMGYFIWYRMNMKYFSKRILTDVNY